MKRKFPQKRLPCSSGLSWYLQCLSYFLLSILVVMAGLLVCSCFFVWTKYIFLPTNSVVMAVLLLVMAVLLLFLSLLSVVMTVLLLVMAVLLQYCLSVFCQWLWLCNNFLAAPPQTSLPQPVQQVGYSTQTFKPIYRQLYPNKSQQASVQCIKSTTRNTKMYHLRLKAELQLITDQLPIQYKRQKTIIH